MGFLRGKREDEDPAAKLAADDQARQERQQDHERKDEISLQAIPTTREALDAAPLAELAEAFLLGFFAPGTKGEANGREIAWVVIAVEDNLLDGEPLHNDATVRIVNEAFQLLELNRYLYRYRQNVNTGYEQFLLTRRGQAAVASGRVEIVEIVRQATANQVGLRLSAATPRAPPRTRRRPRSRPRPSSARASPRASRRCRPH